MYIDEGTINLLKTKATIAKIWIPKLLQEMSLKSTVPMIESITTSQLFKRSMETLKITSTVKSNSKLNRRKQERYERGSTAQKSSARILTAQHFFWKWQLLNRKMSTAWKTKVCRTCTTFCFQAVDKIFATAKYKSSIFFHIGKKETLPNLT